MAGIYIHIPFCSQFCTYCNFYSVKQLGLRERFVQAMVNEIKARKDFFKNIGSSVTTVYIGGGTPSVLLPHQLATIVDALTETFGLHFPTNGRLQKSNADTLQGSDADTLQGSDADTLQESSQEISRKGIQDIAVTSVVEEFTIEVNPNDITPEYAAFLISLGVNRVSMGMQSFEDSHLKWMNRRHTSQEGIQAYRILRDADINNISLDLIFGYAPLSAQQWEKNIDTMIALAPEHISAYQMSIEPGSRLSAMARNGAYTPPSDEECLRQYTLLQTKLSAAGYHQYEISNFARQKSVQASDRFHGSAQGLSISRQEAQELQLNLGISRQEAQVLQLNLGISEQRLYASMHNSSYWDGTPYLGLGPAAHSFSGLVSKSNSSSGVSRSVGGARRMWNTPSVKKYCSYCYEDIVGYEDLTVEDIFNETIMLGLRRTCGFPLDSLASLDASLLREIMPDINRLVMSGQLIMEDRGCVELQPGSEDRQGAPDLVRTALGKNIRIPADKLFISDSIIRELFV